MATGAFPDGERGLSLPRARLDHALLETAADAGVDLRLGIRVNGGRDAPLGRSDHPPRARSARGVRSSGPAGRPAPWSARVVVGADGLRSTVARSLGAYRRPPRLRKVSVSLHVEGIRPGPHTRPPRARATGDRRAGAARPGRQAVERDRGRGRASRRPRSSRRFRRVRAVPAGEHPGRRPARGARGWAVDERPVRLAFAQRGGGRRRPGGRRGRILRPAHRTGDLPRAPVRRARGGRH